MLHNAGRYTEDQQRLKPFRLFLTFKDGGHLYENIVNMS